MRFFSIAAALLLFSATTARADDNLSAWSPPQMRQLLKELGATTTGQEEKAGVPYLHVTAASGLKFAVIGQTCEGAGEEAKCRGAEIATSFGVKSPADALAKAGSLDYAAVSAFARGDHVRLARYVIFDHGVSRENAKTNITVFLTAAEQVRSGL
jgi:hypothetical protein